MKFGTKIKYQLLLLICRMVGILPSWFLYNCLLYVIYFFAYKVLRYRVEIVRGNLARSFPEKTERERRRIEKRFYLHLSEVMLDAIDIVSISASQMRKRIIFEGSEQHEVEVAGKNWIGALGHYGSWEYFAAYKFYTRSQSVGVYKPLHDEAFDRLYFYARSRFGSKPVAMHDLLRFVVANKDNPDQTFLLGMVSDQTPPPSDKPHWFKFLNQDTAFFMGMEKLALKFGMPVYYVHMKKLAKRRYKTTFDMIYDGREKVEEGVITGRYAARLEEDIRAVPELWIWSHRRWKHRMKPAKTE